MVAGDLPVAMGFEVVVMDTQRVQVVAVGWTLGPGLNVVELRSPRLVIAARISAFGVSGVDELAKFSTGFISAVAEIQYLSGYRIVEESSPFIVRSKCASKFGIEWSVAG